MMVFIYKCKKCGKTYEVQPLDPPPICHNLTTRRVYTTPGTIFKGTGFYRTDKAK